MPPQERESASPILLPGVLLMLFWIGGLSPVVAASSEAVVSRWATALESGQLSDFCDVAVSEQDLSSAQWRDVREIVETTEDIQVRIRGVSELTSGDSTEMRIELDGTGWSRTANPRRVVLPSVWFLTVIEHSRSPRILAARTQESKLVEQLIAASTASRARLLDSTGLPAGGLARSLCARPLRLDEVASVRQLAELLRTRSRQERDRSAEGDAVITLARVERAAGNYLEARRLIDDWVRDLPPSAEDLIARGYVAAAATAGPEETLLFMRYLGEAQACLNESSDPRLQFDALYLATTYQIDTFQLTAAYESVQRFHNASAARGWTYALAWATYFEGSIFRTVHNDRAAAERFSESARLAALAGRSDVQSWALLLNARSERRIGLDPGRLLQILESARAAAPQDAFDLRTYLLSTMALVQLEAGKIRAADETAKELLSILPITEANDSRRDGWYAVEETRRAQKRYAEAADAAAESLRAGERWILWLSFYTKLLLAEDLRKLGKRNEALANLQEAIELIETRRALIPLSANDSVHYFTDKAANYRVLADLLNEMGRPLEALRIIERGRSGTLRDLQSGMQKPSALTPAERASEKNIETAIVALNRRVVTARSASEKKEARRGLRQKRLDLERFQTELAVSKPETAIRQSIAAAPLKKGSYVPALDTAILEYAVSDDHTMLFVVTRRKGGAPQVTALRIDISGKSLSATVDAFVGQLRSRDFDYHRGAQRLYRLLIAPAANLIRGRSALCIIPDNVLWRLPFQVLEGAANEPLLVSRTISYAPSIAMLESADRTSRPSGRPRSLLVLGDPGRSGEAALSDSAQEIRSIARLYPNREVLTGKIATESSFRQLAAGRDVLHFATHGRLDAESPMFSALLLAAKDESEDGSLEAREVAQMHLDARVAVLSACDLGGGRIYEGEGILGMSWAFFVAGCPTTVVSQWLADSRATARLMIGFHRYFSAGASAAGALRRAALDLRSDPDYSHPFYWSAFEAVGAASAR
jgi:CHAT domain-containing protein